MTKRITEYNHTHLYNKLMSDRFDDAQFSIQLNSDNDWPRKDVPYISAQEWDTWHGKKFEVIYNHRIDRVLDKLLKYFASLMQY